MTVAIDVILGSIDEPVRFVMECKARVFQQFEMFWQVPRKAVNEKYFLVIKVSVFYFGINIFFASEGR